MLNQSLRLSVFGTILLLAGCGAVQKQSAPSTDANGARVLARFSNEKYPDGIHKYDVSSATFSLNEMQVDGYPKTSFQYGPVGNDWTPLFGDWDGDGKETVGLYNPKNGYFYLKNSSSPGSADHMFQFGPAGQTGIIPVTGDWNGDGIDTVGIYVKASATFYLRDKQEAGIADYSIAIQGGRNMDLPIVGDWNGDGIDTVGYYRDSSSNFYLLNSNKSNAVNKVVAMPFSDPAAIPVAGDFNSDGIDTVGYYRPSTGGMLVFSKNHGLAPDLSIPMTLGANERFVIGKLQTCSGKVFQGACWYLGGQNQSCTSVCSSRGGYDEATQSFASSSMANCRATATALGIGQTFLYENTNNYHGVGCTLGYASLHLSWQKKSNPDMIGDKTQRICACKR